MVELLEDEKYVLYALSQYGPLLIPQLHKLLHNKTSSQQARIVKNVKKFHYAYFVEGGRYLGPDPYGKPNYKMVTAMWVLLQFIEKIEPTGHFAANSPSQIFFIKEDTGYEIIVINDGEEHLLRLINPQEKTKYIIVVPDMRMVEFLELPDAPCLFVNLQKGQLITVVYYGIYEQAYLQLTGPVVKVDPYWHSIQIDRTSIDFSEIYELVPC